MIGGNHRRAAMLAIQKEDPDNVKYKYTEVILFTGWLSLSFISVQEDFVLKFEAKFHLFTRKYELLCRDAEERRA